MIIGPNGHFEIIAHFLLGPMATLTFWPLFTPKSMIFQGIIGHTPDGSKDNDDNDGSEETEAVKVDPA